MCRFAASKAGAMAFVSKRAINSELMQILADLVNRGNVVPRINSAQ
jgi:hypothetical protein